MKNNGTADGKLVKLIKKGIQIEDKLFSKVRSFDSIEYFQQVEEFATRFVKKMKINCQFYIFTQ